MAVLQLFCIILVSSSTFFINDVSAAYSCPIRDEAFESVTGKMFYPYVLTKIFKECIKSLLNARFVSKSDKVISYSYTIFIHWTLS